MVKVDRPRSKRQLNLSLIELRFDRSRRVQYEQWTQIRSQPCRNPGLILAQAFKLIPSEYLRSAR